MDSATPPCGCAQNDGIAGSIQVSDGIEGSLHSCSYGADFTHLTLPVCEQHENKGGIYVIEDIMDIDQKRNDFLHLKGVSWDCEIIDLRDKKDRKDDVMAVYKF